MPGNEVEERIRILYELENFSQGQHLSHAVNDSRPVLIYNQWVENQRQISEPLSSNLKNYTVQPLGSLGGHGSESFCAFDQNYGQLTRRSDLSDTLSIKQELNTNGFMLGRQSFQERQNKLEFLAENTGLIPHNLALRGLSVLKSQQEYAPGDSPTLTTNSERSEMTDASTEFNFVGGQQQLVRGQQPGVPQPTSMQQSGYSDVQLLQQHIMFKQLQELQKQQQLQQFGDTRQLSQHSSISKQGSGVQYPTLINGTPVNDASQMFLNRMQRGASPASQGISNRSVFLQEHGQTLRSMPLVSQQFDASLYGTPVANARGTMSHIPNVQGMPHDSPNLFNKVGGQIQKPVMQSMAVNNPFLGDQYNFSPDQAYLPQGAFMSKDGLQGKNMFGHVPLQGFNGGGALGNSLLGTSLQANAPLQELSAKQEPAGWPGVLQQKTMQLAPSQGFASLDPMEEKILYNMDDDVWNAPFGRRNDVVTGFGNALEQTELNAFPSLQSGSWSALMQSAVAEASSSDTGMQEEWSGLSFQNTELSTDNQTSNILDKEKQQRGWADNNLQSDSSLGSKPLSMLNDSSVNSSFPGFHPTGFAFMTRQREDLHQDDSHESIQKLPKDASEWLDCNPQPPLPMEGSEQVQQPMHLDNSWASQINKLAENNAHQQRIASYHIVSDPSSKPEGHASEAMYKKNDSDGFPWKTGGDSFSRSTGGLAQVESDTDSNLLGRENAQLFNFAALPASRISKAHQETSQQVADSNQLDYVTQVKISMNNEENDNTGVKTYQMSNITNVMQDSYRGAEAYGQQQNCSPRDNFHKQGHLGQFKFMGDVSNNAFSLDKGHLPNLQGDLRASEESSGRNLNISATFHRAVGSGGSNINAQTSHDMLELLPKADQSKENTTVSHFGSTNFSPLHEVAEAGNVRAPIAQMYNQSSVSQGFALRLFPPSQQLVNSNAFISQGLPQTASNLNLRQGHSNLGEKNQTQLTPSFQSLPASNELSPRESWGNKFSTSERSNMSSSMYVHQSSNAAIPSNPPLTRNLLQMRPMSNGPVSCSSPQGSLHGTASRYPSFNIDPSQDTSQQIRANLCGQQFPGFEAITTPQPPDSMLQQSGFSAWPPSLWTSTQHYLSSMEPSKVPPVELSRNSVESTSLTQQELNDQDSQKAGYEPSDLGRLHQSHYHSPTVSERSYESFDHSMKQSYGSRQNYSLLHQVQAMKNAETDQSTGVLNIRQVSAIVGQQSAYEPNSTSRNYKDDGLNSALHLRSSSSGDNKMPSFLPEAREDLRVKASSQPALQEMPTQEVAAFRQNDISNQPSGSNVVSEHVENPLASLNMVPSWFKQYGTLRNGQIPPLYEGKLAGSAGVQSSISKPSQNFDIHSSVEQLDVADASQSSRVLPSTAAAVVASEPFSASYLLSSDVIGQSAATVRPKKRKTMTSERLPWHQEVTEGFKRFQDMSIAEQEWAQASYRLIEKVEDVVEMIEDRPPLLRTKRRLVLTTQLMQQLLCPAPAPLLRANAASHYDCVVCYVARLSLGDACSLAHGQRNDLCKPLISGNMLSEELKVSKSAEAEHFSKAVEDFTRRSKKIENDLLRLDKAASILDLRLECQELEKVSVINRFAKFHIRAGDASGTASFSGTAAPRVLPQRYITGLPMPSNVPEGVQCLSL
ncbi:uncharacterized protein LOC21403884 isoform X1 [Morus notabilis]|uniref:uncharacterized protein LOC21403884 isoform X1 n=1 Tax=Morus notabilis TaxID=981085 RepID=UPI000CED6A20|nr:uncharacterized protein LOC21403884 isoform X1 [Morus notabilis]XP_024016919.1 uncharacterized protein LOC21403884 isoform X1 [Morus notabilis]XP_024016920.1 uncharacterized protein LOC21403884 isoform X1 [Morus notabilis]